MKYIIMFIIGTIFGSFYNVVGYRIPKDESIVYPPSHCPKCKILRTNTNYFIFNPKRKMHKM